MKTIGYLGLGIMGYGMTSNLIDKSEMCIRDSSIASQNSYDQIPPASLLGKRQNEETE